MIDQELVSAGKRLKKIREKALGLSQDRLAELLGVTQGHLSAMENNRRNISHNIILKLAEIFPYINMNFLISGDGEIQKENIASSTPIPVHLSPKNVTFSTPNKVDTTKPGHVSEPDIGGYQVERGDVIGEWKILLPGQATRVRIFTVSGTSMFPTLRNGDILICIPTTLGDIEDGKVYVIIDKSLSISAKHAYRFPGGLLMIPANREEYRPIVVEEKDIVEVWKALHRLTSDISEFGQSAPAGDLEKKIDQLEHFIRKMFPDFGDVEGDFGK